MVPKTTVTITISELLTDTERGLIKQIMADAFYNFAKARTPAREYFERAYGTNPDYKSHSASCEKILEIVTRTEVANQLFAVAQMAKVEVEPMTCCYCGKETNMTRHDYEGDDRTICKECDQKDEPGGFWCFHPELKPKRLDKEA